MKFAARFIATMAVAFVMGHSMYADDGAKSAAQVKDDKPVVSVVVPSLIVSAQRTFADAHPGLFPTSQPTLFGDQTQPSGRGGRWAGAEGDTPRVEWFLGYSFWRAMPTSPSNRMGYLHGGSTSVAFNFNRYFGLVADFGGFDNNRLTLYGATGNPTVNSNGSAYTYLFGPRVSFRKYERFTPYIQALFGGAYASSVTISGCTGDPSCVPLGSNNAFGTMFGAGLDIKLSHHVALRLFEGDFLLTHFYNVSTPVSQVPGWQDNIRLSSGIVFRFGGNSAPSNRIPLSATCSAERDFVYVGSGDFVAIRAQASGVDSHPLSYSWWASEGAVDGTGPAARWNSSDRRQGIYMVKVHVDNGRNGTADCSVNIRVEPRPNRPPTISCSTSRNTATAGESVDVTATAADPDNDVLSFSWNTSGGRIEGTGPAVQFQTGGLLPGEYTITGRVDDGRSGTAECMVHVGVLAAQLPAVEAPLEVQQLEARLALHSIYFATERPTVPNPTGGLVESQENVLLLLAADFNRYLNFKPQAHLILEGHADRRGSIEYNNGLTERRVTRAKSFLVEHGVPAENIETRSLGKQDNLDAEQVRQLIDQNPELSNEEKLKLENNLLVIVMANNRRVDISLNTTGQQSVRQYPFNAKDSLALLSTRGAEREKRMSPAPKK
jgi:outer membrane protein OmpA-like peptidoglycan-associated protein/opacity protein-like surface antigen